MTTSASSFDAPSAEMPSVDVSSANASSTVDTQENRALALLSALANEDGQSLPRLAKRLGLAASELQRLLVALGDDPQFGGLGLVGARNDSRGRNCIWLSARGQSVCDAMLSEDMLPEGTLSEDILPEGTLSEDILPEDLRSEGIRERDAT
jgi:IclR helix-turn-helix domain